MKILANMLKYYYKGAVNMKRTSYIDKSGNPVSETFESKKIFLNIFLVIGTIVPIVLLGFIVYTIVENNGCSKIYSSIKTATLDYIKDNDQMPAYDGESETISIDRLYSDEYLRRISTNNLKCSGEVKVTKYKGKLVYTIDVKGCGVCSTKTRYGAWSKETSTFPSGKGIVDVVPYYNYYEREVSATDWSGEFLDEELQDEESEYGKTSTRGI